MEKFIPVAIFIAFIVGVGVIAQLLFGRRHRTHDGLPLPSQGGTMEDHTAGHEDYKGTGQAFALQARSVTFQSGFKIGEKN